MISTGDSVYICYITKYTIFDITALVLAIYRIAANFELRQKVLDLVLISN